MQIRRPVTGLTLALAALAFMACTTDTLPTTPAGNLPQFSHVGNSGKKGGGGTSATPVTSYVANTAADGQTLLLLRSDGDTTYTNSSTLTSEIQSIGDWVLDASTRQVYLDFSQPVSGTGAGNDGLIPPSGLYSFRAISRCSLDGYSFLTLAQGATVACPLHVAFTYNGDSYAVEMNPNNASETDNATVSCTAAASGACTAWTITPSGASGTNEAQLIHYVTVRGKTQNVDEGDYDFTFRITVTNP